MPTKMIIRNLIFGGSIPVLVAISLLPTTARAQCGPMDLQACADGAIYTTYEGIAAGLWLLDRTLLIAAYYCYAIRWWVIDVAFTTVADILKLTVDPLIIPLAILALLIGLLLILLMPLTGKTSLINVRTVLAWAIAAPLILTIGGTIMRDIDNARVAGAAALFQDVVTQAGAQFQITSQAQVDKMAAPRQLYGSHGSSACPTSYFSAEPPAYLRSDELAAALFWADASDIHCPGNDRPLPSAWYDAQQGPGYAFDGAIDNEDPQRRGTAIRSIQNGINRLIIGLFPTMLALIDALIQLAYSLALVLLWISLLVALPFAVLQQQANPLSTLLRSTLDLFTSSWTSSVILAILFAGLKSLATSGHALAVVGFSMGGMIAAGVILLTALGAAKQALSSIGTAVVNGSGLNTHVATNMISGGAGLLAGTATGGASMALTAGMALQQTGSGRYAAAAAAARIQPVMQVGAVAAAMGWIDDTTERGLWAGSRRSLPTMQRQMRSDARRFRSESPQQAAPVAPQLSVAPALTPDYVETRAASRPRQPASRPRGRRRRPYRQTDSRT